MELGLESQRTAAVRLDALRPSTGILADKTSSLR